MRKKERQKKKDRGKGWIGTDRRWTLWVRAEQGLAVSHTLELHATLSV